jgi:CheY-like chemotaxis protein
LSGKKSLRILVAEDNEVNQTVIRDMLEYAGHQVDTVLNGKSAIDALKKQTYDLLILDCLMPVMDGFAATRCIRTANSPGFDVNIPILAITALGSAENQQKCLNAGMSGFISKPIIAKDLFAWISGQLGAPIQSCTDRQHSGQTPDNAACDRRNGYQAMGAAELIRKMSPLLIRDAEQWQRELQDLCDHRQFGELGSLAHKIRGTADVLGDSALSKLARELELSANAGNASSAVALAGRLIEALRQLIRDIQSSM